jgi:hypothetical protein
LSRYCSNKQPPEELIEEVMERIKERAERIDATWKRSPEGWYIAKGNAIKVLARFDLPDDAKSLIEERCSKSVEFSEFTEVIVKKRWVIILFPPLRYKI